MGLLTSGTPSLQQLLEDRTQNVVTCVGFRKLFHAILETTMPIFGSTHGGKSGVASVPEKDGTTASKGARPKEDPD